MGAERAVGNATRKEEETELQLAPETKTNGFDEKIRTLAGIAEKTGGNQSSCAQSKRGGTVKRGNATATEETGTTPSLQYRQKKKKVDFIVLEKKKDHETRITRRSRELNLFACIHKAPTTKINASSRLRKKEPYHTGVRFDAMCMVKGHRHCTHTSHASTLAASTCCVMEESTILLAPDPDLELGTVPDPDLVLALDLGNGPAPLQERTSSGLMSVTMAGLSSDGSDVVVVVVSGGGGG